MFVQQYSAATEVARVGSWDILQTRLIPKALYKVTTWPTESMLFLLVDLVIDHTIAKWIKLNLFVIYFKHQLLWSRPPYY